MDTQEGYLGNANSKLLSGKGLLQTMVVYYLWKQAFTSCLRDNREVSILVVEITLLLRSVHLLPIDDCKNNMIGTPV